MIRNIVINVMFLLLIVYVFHKGNVECEVLGIDNSNGDINTEQTAKFGREVLVLDELDTDNEELRLIYGDDGVKLDMNEHSMIINSTFPPSNQL